MLTVNVNYILCADGTMATMEPVTAKNATCELANVTDLKENKSKCDSEIIYLYVINSTFEKFPPLFEYFSNLQSITVKLAGIRHIESTIFEKAANLTSLYTDGNDLKTLQNQLFTKANKLSSFSMVNCGIEIIEEFAFQGLSNLKKLDLSNNKITHLYARIFVPLVSLSELRLSNNSIEVIDKDTFIQNGKLDFAMFDNNKITIVDPDSFRHCQLRTLDLGNNQLSALELTNIKFLKRFTVTNNFLSTLDVPPAVTKIFAGNNTISVITSDGTNELVELHMPTNHFANLQNLSSFNKLTFLDLSSNQLKNFTFSEVKALSVLNELKLSGNKLAEIRVDDVTANLPKLRFIELSTKHWDDTYVHQLETDLKSHNIQLCQNRSSIPDDGVAPRPLPPSPPKTTASPSNPTQSPNSGSDQRISELDKKLADVDYKTRAELADYNKRIDGRLVDMENKLTKSKAESNEKYGALLSSFKTYQAMVIVMLICGLTFALIKVVLYSKTVLSRMQYRRAQSREPIFSEQDL